MQNHYNLLYREPGHIKDAVVATDLFLSKEDLERLEGAYTPRPLAELPWSSTDNEDPRLETDAKPSL